MQFRLREVAVVVAAELKLGYDDYETRFVAIPP